jgi:hypothetical protein
MTTRPVSNFSNPCLYGIVKQLNDLRTENKQLKEQLNYFLGNCNINNDSTELYYAKKDWKELFHPPEDLLLVPDQTFFFTLTFDPDKFGYNNDPEHEEDYILIVLHKAFKDKERFNINGIYMCFEKHKSGVIHAHGITRSSPYYMKVIKHYLKTSFTNNPRNRTAVQYEPSRPNGIQYIGKLEEYKRWFIIGDINIPLNYGLD